jgi:hypothetical protein
LSLGLHGQRQQLGVSLDDVVDAPNDDVGASDEGSSQGQPPGGVRRDQDARDPSRDLRDAVAEARQPSSDPSSQRRGEYGSGDLQMPTIPRALPRESRAPSEGRVVATNP